MTEKNEGDLKPKGEGSEEERDYKALFEAASAILGHLHPGVNVEDELGNVAVKLDGTPVYVGDLEAASEPADPVEEGDTGQKVAPPRKRSRAPRSPALRRGGGKAKVDIDSMSIEERAALYDSHVEKGYKS